MFMSPDAMASTSSGIMRRVGSNCECQRAARRRRVADCTSTAACASSITFAVLTPRALRPHASSCSCTSSRLARVLTRVLARSAILVRTSCSVLSVAARSLKPRSSALSWAHVRAGSSRPVQRSRSPLVVMSSNPPSATSLASRHELRVPPSAPPTLAPSAPSRTAATCPSGNGKASRAIHVTVGPGRVSAFASLSSSDCDGVSGGGDDESSSSASPSASFFLVFFVFFSSASTRSPLMKMRQDCDAHSHPRERLIRRGGRAARSTLLVGLCASGVFFFGVPPAAGDWAVFVGEGVVVGARVVVGAAWCRVHPTEKRCDSERGSHADDEARVLSPESVANWKSGAGKPMPVTALAVLATTPTASPTVEAALSVKVPPRSITPLMVPVMALPTETPPRLMALSKTWSVLRTASPTFASLTTRSSRVAVAHCTP